jgi:hypothetical protein
MKKPEHRPQSFQDMFNDPKPKTVNLERMLTIISALALGFIIGRLSI